MQFKKQHLLKFNKQTKINKKKRTKIYCFNRSLFSSSLNDFIISVDSENCEWFDLAAWNCTSSSFLNNFPHLKENIFNKWRVSENVFRVFSSLVAFIRMCFLNFRYIFYSRRFRRNGRRRRINVMFRVRIENYFNARLFHRRARRNCKNLI